MEERKYTFYDRYQKVKYANITAEELEVLNISYNIIRNIICLISSISTRQVSRDKNSA